MSFHEVRFPTAIYLGSAGGPERKTDVVTLANGFEERNSVWAHSRRKYDAGVGMTSLDDLAVVTAFFEARKGRLYGFRWKDWADFRSCSPSSNIDGRDQHLADGDGSTQEFQLRKAYRSSNETYWRPITKPVEGSILVELDDQLLVHASDYFVNLETGKIAFTTPPPTGVRITAGFEFDVPVRFELDSIEVSVTSFSSGQIPNIPVIEVRV